jgi:filamentous hemagglutinin
MNRHLYRLVFNAARGQIMAVAEVATSHTGSSDAAGATSGPQHHASGTGWMASARSFAPSTIASVCALLMALPPGQMAHAQVVADPQAAASLRPQILSTANGTTQVNIQTPSAAGVSRNVYSQFDVDNRGVILNNATAATQTQIGGWVQANGNLSGGGARVILNEVNATAPSQLRGFVEVAGQRAEVVIANPAGIAVNGGGFINASAVTLTTGTPILNSGDLEGYRVTGGQIQINGAGLDASGADYARILARAVQVNAGLWAQDLKVVTGSHLSNADASVVSPLAPSAGTTPQYALDVATLGGMYAGKITLIGTEAGLGVNNSGTISTNSGDIVLQADGTLTNTGQMQGSDKLTLRAAHVHNTGNLLAGSTLAASATDAQGRINNSGNIIGGSVTLQATQSLTNSGPQALIGATDTAGRLTLLSDSITNADDVTATDAMPTTTIYGAGDVILAGGIDSDGNPTRATSITNRSGLIESVGTMTLAAQTVTNTRRTLVMSNNYDQTVNPAVISALNISLSGSVGQMNSPNPNNIGGVYIDPPHGGSMNSDYLYTVYSGVATQNALQDISPAAQIISGTDLNVAANTLQNRWSRIASGRNIDLGNATLDQESWQGAERSRIKVAYSGNYIYRTYRGDIWSHSFCDSGCSAGGDTRYYVRTDYESSLTATGTIRGTGGTIINGTSSTGLVAPPPATVRNPSLTLPGGGLFQVTGNTTANYLIESNPRFTNYQQWLSSDYLLAALSLDPTAMQKRLGDGYYEQRLVREQLLELTGRQFLTGHASVQDSYQALLNNAVTYAQAHDLRPGIALSADQMAQLTSDIVWLVEREVVLPNGQTTTALVPQVYLSQVSRSNLSRNGALIAAADIDLQDLQGVSNGGTIQASRDLALQTLGDLSTTGGTLSAGRQMILYAGGNIHLDSAKLQAATLALNAGQDLRMETLTSSHTTGSGSLTTLGQQTSVTVTGDATIASGRDTKLIGANLTVGGNLDLQTGGDLEIGAAQTRETKTVQRHGGSASSDFIQNIGSSVVVGGNTQVSVGNNLTVAGSALQLGSQASNTAELNAGGDVTFTAVKDSGRIDSSWNTSGGKYGTSSQGQYSRLDEAVLGASLSSGGSLSISAGKDVNIAGSAIGAAGSATVKAAGDINVGTVEERHTSSLQAQGSKSGLMRATQIQERNSQASTLAQGSSMSGQSLSLQAGQDVNVTASDISAEEALQLKAGRDVNVLAGFDTQASSSFSQTTSSAGKLAKALGSSLAMADLVGTVAPGTGTQITVAALLTRERQQDETVQSSTTVRSSNLSGGTVQIESGRDTTLQAAQVVADGQVKVLAAGDIKLLAAEQTSQSQQNSETDKSGLLSKKLLSSSVGKSEQDYKEQGTTTTSVVTQIASLGKDSQGQAVAHAHVQLKAQGGVSGEGAQLLAPAGDITVQGSSVQLLEARNEVSMASQQSSKTTAVTSQMGSTLVSAVQNIDRATELRSQAKESGDKRTQMLADLNVALAAYNAFGGGSGSPGTPTPQVGPTAGFTAGTSIGASQSSSESQQQQSTGTQGQILAGGDIRISAVGAGQDSNLTLQGQNVQAGGQVALSADHQVNLLASQDTASQQSSNNSSGGAVGVTFSAGGNQNGFSFQLSANKALGKADGDSTTYNNTHVTGDSVSIKSGDDTTLKGAVVTAREVSADVGGNLLIESQQDQAVYTDKQSSSGAGVSLCIPPICVGQMAVVNVSLAKANIDSDYLSVGEQSAIRAGDGGFTVKVGGDTTLTGAQITSTQAAIDHNKNSFSTDGTLTTQDLQNQAAFEAKSVSVSISTGGGGAGGYGSDSGSASSTSTAAISGIAGDSKARTGDAETGIKPIFDAAKVKQDIQLQTAVTAEFGRNASKAVGDYAEKQLKKAKENNDKESMDAWKEGGSARVALHALVGGLSLGAKGALGATATSTAAPLINQLQTSMQEELVKAGFGQETAKAIAGLTGAGTAAVIGGAAGGVAGATTAFNADVNNRQLHPDERKKAAELAQKSGGKYTQEEIENAMRNAGSSALDETSTTGMIVKPNSGYDVEPSFVPGTNKGVVERPYDTGSVFRAGDNGQLVQVLPNNGSVDPGLAAFIAANTGGAQTPYGWNDVQLGKVQPPTTDPNSGVLWRGLLGWGTGASQAGLAGSNDRPTDVPLDSTTDRVIQGIFPAHTAPLARDPIGGSVDQQVEWANQVNTLREFAIDKAVYLGGKGIDSTISTIIKNAADSTVEKFDKNPEEK